MARAILVACFLSLNPRYGDSFRRPPDRTTRRVSVCVRQVPNNYEGQFLLFFAHAKNKNPLRVALTFVLFLLICATAIFAQILLLGKNDVGLKRKQRRPGGGTR